MTKEPLSDDAERGFLLYFCQKQRNGLMSVFLAILIMMTTISVGIFLVVRVVKNEYPSTEKVRIALLHFVAVTLMHLSNILCGGDSLLLRLPLDMLVALFPMLIVVSSVWEEQSANKLSSYLTMFVWILTLFHILEYIGLFSVLAPINFIYLTGVVSILICFVFLFAIFLRLREIREIMRNGNVWSSVCLTMDFVYLLTIVVFVTALLISTRLSTTGAYIVSGIVALLMTVEHVALGIRAGSDSLFVICHRHERRIVESMKISQTEVQQDSSKIDDMYKNLYMRVVNLFETDKPYLNSELTINDIVKDTFTNKLYISRAISQFTGRNFCQFVNYYRVLHSIQIFRENPNLKVIEMATKSGFNSTVSFSAAFRLYMSESPSDWCRREKLKITRRKK